MGSQSDHKVGFDVVYDSPSVSRRRVKDDKVDIVAIHGIGAWSHATWKHRSNVNWLSDQDMLPSQLPNSRIMIYGYGSDWKGDDPISTTTNEIAEAFVSRLLQQRIGYEPRPILFIAHCFGGVVLMRVMKLLRDRHADVLRYVVGLFFLGTPFRGISSSLGNGKIVQYVAEQGQSVSAEILAVLGTNNESLSVIRREFSLIASQALPLPKIVCFCETKQSKVWAIAGNREMPPEYVVDKSSATYDGADAIISLERDHFSLNKFEGPGDQAYIDVASEICSVVESTPKIMRDRKRYKLDYPQISTRPRGSRGQEPAGPVISHSKRRDTEVSIERPRHIAWSQWVEPEIPVFETAHEAFSAKLKGIAHGIFGRKPPFACGVSTDGSHVFTLQDDKLMVFPVPSSLIGVQSVECCNTLDPPGGCEFHAAKMSRSVLAAICTRKGQRSMCILRKVVKNQGPNRDDPQWHSVPKSGASESSEYSCIAVHEGERYALVALGVEKFGGLSAEIHLYRVSLSDWTIERPCFLTDVGLETTEKQSTITDPPKLLNFSPDGKLLICSTRKENKVMVWKIRTEPGDGQARKICATSRTIGVEKDVLGITAVFSWFASSGHPYLLATTWPSSQRSKHEGEWSFIAPAADPFPAHQDLAFHCLIDAQTQDYYAIIDGVVSHNRNAIALVSTRGNICVLPLVALDGGGIGSVHSGLVRIKKDLQSPYQLFEAALGFSDGDRRLVAVDRHGKLVVAEFSS